MLFLVITIHLIIMFLTYIDINKSNYKIKNSMISLFFIAFSFILSINIIYDFDFMHPVEIYDKVLSLILMR